VIAALGPVYGGESLDDASAGADRRCIDLWVMPNWLLLAWRMNATEQARRLARTPAFGALWRTFVVRLHDLGEEYLEIVDVDALLESVTGVGLLSGSRAPKPRPPLGTGVRIRRSRSRTRQRGTPKTSPGSSDPGQ
jgi:hypothetical protein